MPDSRLHLSELSISQFRGIDQLSIPRLGRVTLLAGKNSIGKSTVLDAIRVYAARGRYSVLSELLRDRQEVTEITDEDGDRTLALDWMSLFHGRKPSKRTEITIGRTRPEDLLKIGVVDDPQTTLFPDLMDSVGLKVSFREHEQLLLDLHDSGRYRYRPNRRFVNEEAPPSAITCEHLGPGMLNERHTSRLWDSVALTEDETHVQAALNMVVGVNVAGVAMVGDSASRNMRDLRRVIVKLGRQDRPVPLKSLGDGAVRLFGVALALANSRGGFLLIDEAENGIHHTVQHDLWKMILLTAQENDVQVLATTHSWDCVRGFAYAAAECVDGEALLLRLDRDDRGLRAVDYSKEGLLTAAEQGIEVR